MKNDDPQFESFLKSFRSRAPRPLPETPKPVWWRPVLAAAAVILLACGIWLASRWSTLHRTASAMKTKVEGRTTRIALPAATLGHLQRLANTDPQRLDAVLNAQASTLLPDVKRPNGALHVLAKE